jgi:hypothetical protein
MCPTAPCVPPPPGVSPLVSRYGVPSPQGAPLSGTFRLAFGTAWTAAIPYDASAATFEALVNAASPTYKIRVEGYNWSPLTGAR